MQIDFSQLASRYESAHDTMRNVDGLQPAEAFDELLKYLFLREKQEEEGRDVLLQGALRLAGSPPGADPKADRTFRADFKRYLGNGYSWLRDIWPDRQIRLSQGCLSAVHEIFSDVRFTELAFDLRSAALKVFLGPELRRGLGIYLTPDDVARMVVDIANPPIDSLVYDPCCGSGTFLVETLRHWRSQPSSGDQRRLYGSDINPRMLLLAELNLGHSSGVAFERWSTDFLGEVDTPRSDTRPDRYDFILTNPPFGVTVSPILVNLASFQTCRALDGKLRTRQSSEVLFFERCLRLLKPGGLLGIVLPRSVLTNNSLDGARVVLDEMCAIEQVVSLPTETFMQAGTQTSTVVLFARRHGESNRRAAAPVLAANIGNVGFDSTGRSREGNELPHLGASLRQALSGEGNGHWRELVEVPPSKAVSHLARALVRKTTGETVALSELVELVTTGRTPPRAAYTDNGLFILKVGNLRGKGIDWSSRDRNFVGSREAEKRRRNPDVMLRPGDILMTSSAHAVKYIAKKVDIITNIPEWLNGEATFVGELMLLRVKRGGIDPFLVLAYLRLEATAGVLQSMARGQTAHLAANDVLALRVPSVLLGFSPEFGELRDLLHRETEIASELSQLTPRIHALAHEAFGCEA